MSNSLRDALSGTAVSNAASGANQSLRDVISGAISGVSGVLQSGSYERGPSNFNASLLGGNDNGGGRNGNRVYGGYGGYGGGYGSAGPTANQRKAGNLLGSIVGYNAGTIKNNFDNMMDAFDIADKQNEKLRDANILFGEQSASADWFPQLYKLQIVDQEMKKKMGPALRGSGMYDLTDKVSGAFDLINGETLKTMRDNANNANLSYFETLAQNNNSRNEAAADVENALRELAADYQSQLVNIHPDLATGMDTGKHTMTPPDWLDTDFYDEHKVEAATPDKQGLYRPDKAVSTAWDSGVASSDRNTIQSAFGSYWDRMNRGYDQRRRQA